MKMLLCCNQGHYSLLFVSKKQIILMIFRTYICQWQGCLIYDKHCVWSAYRILINYDIATTTIQRWTTKMQFVWVVRKRRKLVFLEDPKWDDAFKWNRRILIHFNVFFAFLYHSRRLKKLAWLVKGMLSVLPYCGAFQKSKWIKVQKCMFFPISH